ncbi:DUF2442 domain-containing protein [Candidatus Protochlamydia sp. R18]|uniref:DUF2442 domain-containing protein n=1 Tax=Candidatus Protochlamydia sp. R18 TaxID=1353977 RepID=UPI0005A825AA|nr:DUF2442 domain-containing protein [Candidatus Protochlamydia sp. R18]
MNFVKDVKYMRASFQLASTFENNKTKLIDLNGHLEIGIFKLLRDISYFKTVRLGKDLDTIVWDNGADISPDFLYEIGNDLADKG